MKRACLVLLIVLLSCAIAFAEQPSDRWLGHVGLGTLGGLTGAVVSVSAIARAVPQIESRWGRTAFVIGSVTVIDGLGAAGGVLAAARIWDSDGSPGACIVGGMMGGLASAFVEPLLSVLGVSESWTEFLGMVLLPVLPAIGAMIGFRL